MNNLTHPQSSDNALSSSAPAKTKTGQKRGTRRRLTEEERAARWQQSLQRAVTSESMANFDAIIEGFAAKGIPAEDIVPRQNVFTFHAWKALGRQVKKGEHGVQIATVIEFTVKGEANEDGTPKVATRPGTTTVFHVSQTELMKTATK
jgi:hypothetical protein